MSREILITTPENIAIEYELAGIGTRFIAYLVDVSAIVLILIILTIIAVLVELIANWIGSGALTEFVRTVTSIYRALSVIVVFIVFWGYSIFSEIKMNGQSPGKKMLGLRVIREGGYPVSVFGVIIRNLLRIVDFMPLFFFAGVVSILVTRDYQRIGDLVGGTIVVKQRPPQSLDGLLRIAHITPEHLDPGALAHISHQADMLTPDEYRAVRHFTERRRQLTFTAQQNAAIKIAVPLMRRLNIVPPAGASMVNYADFLEYLAVAYELLRRPK